MKKIREIVLFIVFCFSFAPLTFALDTDTHKKINEYIATNTLNGFSLDTYLSNQLGFTNGIKEEFKSGKTKKVWEWIQFGGEYEDKPPEWYSIAYLRSVNHFHNPLTDQGYSGFWGTGIMSGMSSTQWAMLSQSTQSPGGYYSWNDVKDYYYKALTLGTKTESDTYFAKTFRGLGQLMHLIQDVSVPEHTRDDGHYLNLPWQSYEKWVKKNATNISNYSPTDSDFFAGTISNVASLIDTNTYKADGSNPEDTASNTVGISEYTNANFLSWDTMFTSGFPHPSLTGAEIWKDTTNNRKYFKKTSEGISVNHLAVSSFLYFYRLEYFPQYQKYFILGMDSKVYSDYASLLIPRAIGYSSGLLNYFFRGELEVVQNLNSNSITITNNSSEDMDGTFTLYYDASDDTRKSVSDGSWSLSLDAGETSSPLSFTKPTDLDESKPYITVFKGTLGSESDAAVGKTFQLCTDELKLTASDATSDGLFGHSVAISGDVAIVGAISVGDYSGAAYVFDRNGDTWEEKEKLIPSDAAAGDWFGYSVAISGNVVILGFPLDDDAGYNSGSAYIFVRNGDTWEEQAKLTASDAEIYNSFGASVAISGDVAIVSSLYDYYHYLYETDSGAAYIFLRIGDTWEESKKLTPSDGAVGKSFGKSVALSGDVAIVGSPYDNDAGDYSGSAYVFVRNNEDIWEEKEKLIPNDADEGDEFGSSVAISGDVAIVGSPFDDIAVEDSGSAYIFVRNGDTWNQQAKLIASDASANDRFGNSVALSGDVAIIGSASDDTVGNDSGSAYVFVRNGDMWEEKKKLTSSDAQAEDHFGSSVAISGDTAIIGSPYDDDAGSNSGSAYIKYYNRCPQ